MIVETLQRIAAGSATTALLAADLGIDTKTLAQRLEMLERMGYLVRVSSEEEGCESTGACRRCPCCGGGAVCWKEKSFLALSSKGATIADRTPRGPFPGRPKDAAG